MKIAKLLTDKGGVVVTIEPGATVADAVADLRRHQIGALVVSTDGLHIEGIVSERDIVRALADGHEALLDDTVRTIMTEQVVTCSPEDEVESLMSVMTDHRVRHVPVVANSELKGIVSIGDVVKSRIGELERDRQELVEYINAR